jgi:hypothetical protein
LGGVLPGLVCATSGVARAVKIMRTRVRTFIAFQPSTFTRLRACLLGRNPPFEWSRESDGFNRRRLKFAVVLPLETLKGFGAQDFMVNPVSVTNAQNYSSQSSQVAVPRQKQNLPAARASTGQALAEAPPAVPSTWPTSRALTKLKLRQINRALRARIRPRSNRRRNKRSQTPIPPSTSEPNFNWPNTNKALQRQLRGFLVLYGLQCLTPSP